MTIAPERSGGVYLDTSALGRVLLREPDAGAVLRVLSRFAQHLASRLMRVELRRLALRQGVLREADQLLSGVALVPITETVLDAAGTIGPPTVAALDAVHLVTALDLAEAGALDAIITFDRHLAEGARHHSLEVLAPE